MFVLKDETPLHEALEVATMLWGEVCCSLSAQPVGSVGRRDWDYSPSKPASKIARMVARAASFLAPSP